MSVNKYLPHVFVLPEDDATREYALGFMKDHAVDIRRAEILNVAGGWREVLRCFQEDHISNLERCTFRHMVLVIDFDKKENQMQEALGAIPVSLRDRVFVLGPWSNADALRTAFGCSKEEIGKRLAEDCRRGTSGTWDHELLAPNAGELGRLRETIRPILFPDAGG